MPDTMIITDTSQHRCIRCQVSAARAAKFCWMCGSPINVEKKPKDDDFAQAKLIQAVDQQRQGDYWTLQMAPLLAIPVGVIIIYGLARVEPFYAWVFGPGLIVGALVALTHQYVFKATIGPQSAAQRASIAGSSLIVGLLAGVVTASVTVTVAIVLIVMTIVSVVVAFMDFCRVSVNG